MASRTGPYNFMHFGSLSGGTAALAANVIANCSQGDTLLLAVCTNAAITGGPTITDTQGNLWGLIYADTNQTTAMLYVYECDNANALGAGTDQITINYGGSVDPVVHDILGIGIPGNAAVGVSPLDQISIPADGNSGTATTGTITPTLAAETAIAFIANGNSPVTWTAPFSFLASTTDTVHSRISCATLALSSQSPVSAAGTFASAPWAAALITIAPAVTLLNDSLVINEQIELLGGGVLSVLPQCSGASFRLMPGYDLGAPQPTTDYVGSLLLDGERPFGRRASNRTIKLSVQIRAPNFIQLAAAREALMDAVDQDTWSLRWTRKAEPVTGNPNFAGNLNLPLIFDCFRAQPSIVLWGGYDRFNRQPVGQVDLTFDALPYGRSDVPVITTFQTPVFGQTAPPSSVTIDNFTEVVGVDLAAGSDGTFESGVAAWTQLTSCTFAASAVQTFNGNSAALQTVTGSPASASAQPGSSFRVPVVAGKQYRAMGMAFCVAGYANGVQVVINWYRADGAFLSSSAAAATALPANTWTAVITTATAPAHATQALYILVIPTSPPTGTAVFWDDVFLVRNLWSQTTSGPGPFAARWSTSNAQPGFFTDSGAGKTVTYTRNGLTAMNLAQLYGLTLQIGLGSTNYFPFFGLTLRGQIQVSITLTDSSGNTASWSHSRRVRMSSNTTQPTWQKIRMPVPQSGQFNPAAVTGYSLTIASRPDGDLRFADLFISLLTAVPTPSQSTANPSTGWVYDLAGIVGSARAPVSFQVTQPQGTTSTVVKTYQTHGTFFWLAPAGVTTVKAEVIGGGGSGTNSGGLGGAGGGGGEYAAEASVAVTAGNTYSFTVGKGGAGSQSNGQNGSNSSFTGDAVTVTAHGGLQGSVGTGGTGSTNTTHHNGGAGGGDGGTTGGGGGGSSGGSAAAGNAGGVGSSSAVGAPGAAVTGGGAGGAGSAPFGGGYAGQAPGGAGGGGGVAAAGSSVNHGLAGADGQVKLTYTHTATFKTMVIHRPGPTAPDTLCPFVTVPIGDLPNNGVEYIVPSLIQGLNARFNSTYTVVLVNQSWHNGSASRTLTVTANQYEQPGGTKYSTSVTLAVTPNNLPGPLVIMGEITLPISAMPDDNLDGYFTFQVNDTDTADDFQEILLLDTMGQTILVQSPNAYVNFWVDEAPPDRDLGNIMASAYQRADAVSVLPWATIAGPPMYADPLPGTNQTLMVYAAEGAPALSMTYWPRWMFDRVA